MPKFEKTLNEFSKRNKISFSQNQYDALVTLAYNRPNWFEKSGSMNKILKNPNISRAKLKKMIMDNYKKNTTSSNWEKFKKGWESRVDKALDLYYK